MLRRSLIFLVLLSAGCVSLDPHYSTPESPIPATLPGAQGQGKAISHDWQQVIHDPRLQQVVTIALNSNRDVQKAIADIDSARALYGQTNASLFPTVNAALSSTRSRSLANGTGTTAEADGTVSSYTLDLFGRNQSLSRAARETWLASEFTAQNTRLTLIAEISTAWLTLAADNSNLALAKETMASAENSLKIIQRQQQVGTAAATDVSEAMSVYQQARASVASYQTQVMQDKNALNLLAGTTLAENLLPGTLESLPEQMISLVPAGVSSDVLLRRPDMTYAQLTSLSAFAPALDDAQAAEQVEIQVKYEGYIARQQEEIERQQRNENTLLPATLDYRQVSGLSNEVIAKLNDHKPVSIGQASRISGVTPAAISILLVWLKKQGMLRRSA